MAIIDQYITLIFAFTSLFSITKSF